MPATHSINFSADSGGASAGSARQQEAPIVFLDSGVGGLPYLKWVRDHAPRENYIYIADCKNFPYGPKCAEEVFAAVYECMEKVMTICDPKLFVIACNTASVYALESLRIALPGVPIVGTVPAVKPAAAYSKNKRIGILATSATIEARYLDELIERFASFCTVIRMAGQDIVRFVEKKLYMATQEERHWVITDAAARFRKEGVDVVVLACTHFLYLFQEIRAELGDGVMLVDSREGVGRRVISLIYDGDDKDSPVPQAAAAHPYTGYARLYLSGDAAPEAQYSYFADYFGLKLAGTL